MPASYKIDRERRLVTTTGWGVLSLADALVHQEQLLKDPSFDPNFSQLLDVSEVTKFDFGVADVRVLAERGIFSPHSRRAFLVTTALAYGYGRMFEMLRDSMGEPGIRVFRDRGEALDWICPKDKTA
jgi:hypothetical protein